MASAAEQLVDESTERTCMFCGGQQTHSAAQNSLLRSTCCANGWFHEQCIRARIQRAIANRATQVKCTHCSHVIQYQFEARTFDDFNAHIWQLLSDWWRWAVYASLIVISILGIVMVMVSRVVFLSDVAAHGDSEEYAVDDDDESLTSYWLTFAFCLLSYAPFLPYPLSRCLASLSVTNLLFDQTDQCAPGTHTSGCGLLMGGSAADVLEITRCLCALASGPVVLLLNLFVGRWHMFVSLVLFTWDIAFFCWCAFRLRTALFNAWSIRTGQVKFARVTGDGGLA